MHSIPCPNYSIAQSSTNLFVTKSAIIYLILREYLFILTFPVSFHYMFSNAFRLPYKRRSLSCAKMHSSLVPCDVMYCDGLPAWLICLLFKSGS